MGHARSWSVWLVLGVLGSACGSAPPSPPPVAPTSLDYTTAAATYTKGVAITPNEPIVTGGRPTSYVISPSLPAGLSLDESTGVISGTPTETSDATSYVVYAGNATATVQTSISIGVVDVAPGALAYATNPAHYYVNVDIAPNAPTFVGGPVTSWTVTPRLPDNLTLDPTTGVLTGRPVNIPVAMAEYTVTAQNSGGNVQTQLAIAVHGFKGILWGWTPDAGFTTTRLASGEVLIAGGTTPGASAGTTNYHADAQVYHPDTETATAVGSMAVAREGHAATLLNGGKVLIVGGCSGAAVSTCRSTAELYDPSARTFAYTGSLPVARARHTSTLLADGKVLVAGGANSARVAGAEVYDPATSSFSSAGTLWNARYWHTATRLSNGKVLIAGGSGSAGMLRSAELYDPATRSFSLTGELTVARAAHTATLLPDGRVLIAGGTNGTTPLSSVEIYDPATGEFSAAGSLVRARDGASATLLPLGKVLFVGAWTGTTARSAELYDPATAVSFDVTGTLSNSRRWHTATLLTNGDVLLIGTQAGFDVFR